MEKNTIRELINDSKIEGDNLPTIAMICSGGGCRAMIATLGFLLGAQEINLINATRYISVLSGSTWTTGVLLALQENNISHFKDYLKNKMTTNLFDMNQLNNIDDVGKILFKKWSYNENIQFSDIYGSVLISRLMEDFNGKEQKLKFKNIREYLSKNKSFPFPIFNTVIANQRPNNPYQWLEINPFTTGCDYLGGFIPTSYFESRFKNGESKGRPYPEETLGSFLGLFGSAYSITSQDADDHTSSELIDGINEILGKIGNYFNLDLTNQRLLAAQINNFSYKMEHSNLKYDKKLTLVDAGMDFNLPFPPLFEMERNIDIFIVCDATSGTEIGGYQELNKAKNYARKNNIPFPNLNDPQIIIDPATSKEFLVYEESGKPTVIYFPNPTAMATLDFEYTQDEFDELCNTMASIVSGAKDIISKTIKNKTKTKSDESSWFYEDIISLDYPETGDRNGWFGKLISSCEIL